MVGFPSNSTIRLLLAHSQIRVTPAGWAISFARPCTSAVGRDYGKRSVQSIKYTRTHEMNIQILENTPHSLKLRYSALTEFFIGFFVSLIFGLIVFLFSGVMLIRAIMHFGEDWSILIGSLSLFFTVIGALWVRFILSSMLFSSGHVCILHFDQTTKKLNLYPQTIFRKLPAEKIPFVQLAKIEFKEMFHTDDTDDYFTYALDLKTKDKSVWATSTGFVKGGAQSRRHEVEEVARLISEITGIPYTFSTDKPLPEKP